MSYCVNCGVELNESALKCPLCDTPVINPNILKDAIKSEPAFPERINLPAATKHRFSATVLSLLLLLPNIICVITNLLFTPDKLWCIYVVASSALFWFLSIFPFFLKQKYKYLIIAVDAVATAAYIFIFYYYDSAQTGWFWQLAVPLVAGFFGCVTFLVAYFSKKRPLAQTLIAIFASLTALNIFIGLIINLYAYSVVATYITMILAVSCLIVTLFFVAAEKNDKLKAWLSRKFFF